MDQRRTHESPMDFEYQNGTGPMDGRSPFAQISMNSQRNQALNNDKKRSYSAFGSPTKSSNPSLRDPAPNQKYLFSNVLSSATTKPLPAVPHGLNPAFTTPRSQSTYDFDSSGGETPKSPKHMQIDVDSDATPDKMGFRSAFGKLDTTSKPEFKAGSKTSTSPVKESKERRTSWWRSVRANMSPLASSSSNSNTTHVRGKGTEYSHAAERRVEKKRRNNKQLELTRQQPEFSDSEAGETPDKTTAHKALRKVSGHSKHGNSNDSIMDGSQTASPPAQARDRDHWASTLFQFIVKHPTLPHILSFWTQFMLNLFIVLGIMYAIYSFWSTISSDVSKKANEAVAELLAEMAVCAQQYTTNRCERSTRVPAMEVVCSNWEKCMNQDPRNVGRARVSAHTFAEIFNGFIEPISYKTMFFILIVTFGFIGVSNFGFNNLRDKVSAAAQQQQQQQQQHHHYYQNPPPPTPQRPFPGQDWYQQQGLEPAPSGFPGHQIEDAQSSPAKRLLQFR